MRIATLTYPTAVLTAVAGISVAASAHHSTASFDKKKEITVMGTIAEYQWTNPHVFIELDVIRNNRKLRYSVEGGATRSMARFGWKVRTLKAGDKVSVVMNPNRDGTPGGLLVKAILPDGRTLNYNPVG